MNLLRSDRLLASQLFSTVPELLGVNPCSFRQLPPSSHTALGASRNTPTRSQSADPIGATAVRLSWLRFIGVSSRHRPKRSSVS